MGRPEVLAPAGDMEKLRFAVAYGADAVYLAGKAYGMRTASGNFTPDEMNQAVQYCHARGVKVYVTVNTLPRDEEMLQLPQYLSALDEMGVEITDVLSIEVADEAIMERMGGRRVCKKCGATFHVKYNPSPAGENCPCGEPLSIRADDDPEVVKSRLEIYHAQTEPLKEFYNNKGLLKIVIGQEKLEDTTALTLAAL